MNSAVSAVFYLEPPAGNVAGCYIYKSVFYLEPPAGNVAINPRFDFFDVKSERPNCKAVYRFKLFLAQVFNTLAHCRPLAFVHAFVYAL